MGWFSSKTRIDVFTSVSRVIEDNALPETLKKSVIEAILDGGPIASGIIKNILDGPVVGFDKFYRYGRDEYVHGLPNASVGSNQEGRPEVKAAIEAETGKTITLQEMFLDSIDNRFMGWKEVQDNYGYNQETNELTALSAVKGYPVYLVDIVPQHEEIRSTNYSQSNQNPKAGHTPARLEQAPEMGSNRMLTEPTLGSEEGVTIHTVYDDRSVGATGELVPESFYVSLAAYPLQQDYFHARYTYDSTDGTVTGYWLYADDSGTYPDVDAVHNARYTDPGTFFPFVFLRHHGTNRTDSSRHDTEEYKSSTELMKKISMDYQEVGDAINENENVDTIEQATLMLGVPINSTEALDLRYLYSFFSRLHDQTLAKDNVFGGVDITNQYSPKPKNNHTFTIQDKDFKTVLSYGRIQKRTFFGSIGKVGEHTAFNDSFDYTYVVNTSDSDEEPSTKKETLQIPERVFRRQITGKLYEEVRVASPRMTFVVYQKNADSRAYDVTVDETGYDKLLIPLDYDLARKYTSLEREVIYTRSMHMVFNSKVETEVEWYQTGFFQFLMIVAAAAIFIMNPPAGYPALISALGISSVAINIALTVVYYVLQGMLIKWAFKWVLEEMDIEDAFLLAVITSAVALATGQIQQLAFMADELMVTATGLISGFNATLKDRMEDIHGDMEDWGLEIEQKWEELEEIRKLLDTDGLIDPNKYMGQRPLFIPGEGPEAYYSRTLDSTNVGTLVFEELENYVERSLTLPELNDTLEGVFYVA